MSQLPQWYTMFEREINLFLRPTPYGNEEGLIDMSVRELLAQNKEHTTQHQHGRYSYTGSKNKKGQRHGYGLSTTLK